MKNLLLTLAKETTTITKIENAGSDLTTSLTRILNAVVGALAIVCVVVVIFGGISYMTSAGDSAKVKKGKDTILYGCIGLAICALASLIVNFVIDSIISKG